MAWAGCLSQNGNGLCVVYPVVTPLPSRLGLIFQIFGPKMGPNCRDPSHQIEKSTRSFAVSISSKSVGFGPIPQMC